MNLNICRTVDEVIQKLADYFVFVAQDAIEARGRFTVALSGGSSPERLYKLLASESYADKVDWSKCYFFFGDERHVPKDDKESNYRMVKEALFDPLEINDDNVFAVDTTLEPAALAEVYYKTIVDFFGTNEVKFDLILLGLGDNAHTASLFPNTNVLKDTRPGVKEVYLEDKKVYRITMNAPLINAANKIAFLVYREGKAEAVKRVIEGVKDVENVPAQLIQPIGGEAEWFLDTKAASKLSIC